MYFSQKQHLRNPAANDPVAIAWSKQICKVDIRYSTATVSGQCAIMNEAIEEVRVHIAVQPFASCSKNKHKYACLLTHQIVLMPLLVPVAVALGNNSQAPMSVINKMSINKWRSVRPTEFYSPCVSSSHRKEVAEPVCVKWLSCLVSEVHLQANAHIHKQLMN